MKKFIIGGIALGLATIPGLAQQQQQPQAAPTQFDEARNTVSKWIETRRTISQEQSKWRLERELLEQRIQLYEDELTKHQTEIAEMEQKMRDGASTRAELQQREEIQQGAIRVIEQNLATYEAQILQLSVYFPTPLKDRIQSLLNGIPKDPKNTTASAGTRLASLVGILNEVDKFNNSVTVTPESRQIGDQRISVRTLYLGLGQAFYVDSEGKYAGVGIPAANGWQWTERNDLAKQILVAVGVAALEIKPAEFSELPLQVTQVDAIK